MPVLIAEKHSTEYLIHKYWARKPANVVRALISRYTEEGDLVLDPFCGSGVSLIEAARLGRPAIGIDVSPVAALVSRVATQFVDREAVREAWQSLLQAWLPLCAEAFHTADGRAASYCVHVSLVQCPQCDQPLRADRCSKRKSRYRCPVCDSLVAASAGNGRRSAITAVHLSPREAMTDARTLARHTELSAGRYCQEAVFRRFDRPLVPNARILAGPGMSAASLFTARNFSLLAELAERIYQRQAPEAVRDVLLAILTSGAASCSRLIPYRGNLKGGGPAWTVPGFWVAPIHLECNPAVHMQARAKKVLAGLAALARTGRVAHRSVPAQNVLEPISDAVPPENPFPAPHSPVQVFLDDSAGRIHELRRSGVRVKYIFADPPYGDSVPYLEFSQIWNCWLPEAQVRFDLEVVVSDRAQHESRWTEYRQRLDRILQECHAILKEDGHLTLTFNNLDLRAWEAILGAVQSAGFWCISTAYQIPAVVPAKAGFTPTSSYLGDVYATFEKAGSTSQYGDWSIVQEHLRQASQLRGGAVSRTTQMKVAAMTILERNVAARWITELAGHLAGAAKQTPALPEDSPLFRQIRTAAETAQASPTPLSDSQFCAAVAEAIPVWLGLDRHEILQAAGRHP
jgi:SAM-dependent methyltransferase